MKQISKSQLITDLVLIRHQVQRDRIEIAVTHHGRVVATIQPPVPGAAAIAGGQLSDAALWQSIHGQTLNITHRNTPVMAIVGVPTNHV